jgi:5'-nucleotidase
MGGDGYTTFRDGQNVTYGPVNVDARVSCVGSLPQPVNVTVDGRMQKIN